MLVILVLLNVITGLITTLTYKTMSQNKQVLLVIEPNQTLYSQNCPRCAECSKCEYENYTSPTTTHPKDSCGTISAKSGSRFKQNFNILRFYQIRFRYHRWGKKSPKSLKKKRGRALQSDRNARKQPIVSPNMPRRGSKIKTNNRTSKTKSRSSKMKI